MLTINYYINNQSELTFTDRSEAIQYGQNELGLSNFTLYSDRDRVYEILVRGDSRYRLSSTQHSTTKFGNCECCNQHVSEVFTMVKEVWWDDFYANSGSAFGHRECLLELVDNSHSKLIQNIK